ARACASVVVAAPGGCARISVPTPDEVNPWSVRPDPFSTYKPTFEVRTYRLCRRALMFHRFADRVAGTNLVIPIILLFSLLSSISF
ncbi:MAG: SpvB/TcaC N-terminal domain-containing protein, partial [Deltaproteobacteria bacterium]